MGLVIFNASLYSFTLLVYYRSTHKLKDIGFVLLLIYSAVAITGVFWYSVYPDSWRPLKLTPFPFLFLFAVIILSIRPFFIYNSDFISKKLVVRRPHLLEWYSYFFIICSLLSLFFSMSDIITTISNGQWTDVYERQYEVGYKLWSNPIDRVAKWVSYRANLLAIIIFYYFSINNNKNKILIYLLLTAIIVSILQIVIIQSSRGTILLELGKIFFCYLIFEKQISKKIKRRIFVFTCIFLTGFYTLAKLISVSRFGDDIKNSMLLYFGESMLVFNDALMGPIERFFYGDFFLGEIDSKYLRINGGSYDAFLGTHFGTHFFTFVGSWYIDFGAIGTLLIAIFLPVMLFKGWRYKRTISIADLLIYVFFAHFLLNGVFAIGIGYYIYWITIFILYSGLKIFKV